MARSRYLGVRGSAGEDGEWRRTCSFFPVSTFGVLGFEVFVFEGGLCVAGASSSDVSHKSMTSCSASPSEVASEVATLVDHDQSVSFVRFAEVSFSGDDELGFAADFAGVEVDVSGVGLRFLFAFGGGDSCDADAACVCFCFANIAWMPSWRFDIGWMKVADSVPTFPTSFGTA